MKNTKFIKVSTADRLPDKPGTYDSNLGEVFYNGFRQKFEHNDKGLDVFPDYWLDERPDYEEEMKEMLSRIQDLDIIPEEIEDELTLLLKKLKS